MHIRTAKGRIPLLGTAVTDVAEHLGSGGHALPELVGERVERLLRNTERLKARIRQSPAEPCLLGWIPPVAGRRHQFAKLSQHRASVGRIVDAQEQYAPR